MGKANLRIRRERLARGWSQTDVTMLTRLPQGTISLIERGLVSYVPPEWRQRLVRAFGLPEAVLFAEDEGRDAVIPRGAAR